MLIIDKINMPLLALLFSCPLVFSIDANSAIFVAEICCELKKLNLSQSSNI